MLITPIAAAGSATAKLPEVAGDHNRPEPDRNALWDEFPNGRFGDYKSPAFGEQGPWGGFGISVGVVSPQVRISLTASFIAKRSVRSMGPSEDSGRPNANISPLSPLQNQHYTILVGATLA